MYSLEVHIWDKPDTCYRQACLINRQARKCNRQAIKLTDWLVTRGLKLGSDTKVGNGLIYHRLSPTDRELETDHVNIDPDSPKMHSYRPVGSSENTALISFEI